MLEALMGSDDFDQFELLEQKVEMLISLVSSLKEENAALARQLREGEEKLKMLEKDMGSLMADREAVRERTAALLRRIEECV